MDVLEVAAHVAAISGAVSLLCVALVAMIWAADTVFKATSAAAKVIMWHEAWRKANPEPRAHRVDPVEDEVDEEWQSGDYWEDEDG